MVFMSAIFLALCFVTACILLEQIGVLPVKLAYVNLTPEDLERHSSKSHLVYSHLSRLRNTVDDAILFFKNDGTFRGITWTKNCVIPLAEVLGMLQRSVSEGRSLLLLVDLSPGGRTPNDFIPSLVEIFRNGAAPSSAKIYVAFVQAQPLNEWWPDAGRGLVVPQRGTTSISTANIPRFADAEEPNPDTANYLIDRYLLEMNGRNAVLAVEVGFTHENYARKFSTISFAVAAHPLPPVPVIDSTQSRREQRIRCDELLDVFRFLSRLDVELCAMACRAWSKTTASNGPTLPLHWIGISIEKERVQLVYVISSQPHQTRIRDVELDELVYFINNCFVDLFWTHDRRGHHMRNLLSCLKRQQFHVVVEELGVYASGTAENRTDEILLVDVLTTIRPRVAHIGFPERQRFLGVLSSTCFTRLKFLLIEACHRATNEMLQFVLHDRRFPFYWRSPEGDPFDTDYLVTTIIEHYQALSTHDCFKHPLFLEFAATKFSLRSVENGTITSLGGVEAIFEHELPRTYHKRVANVGSGPLDVYVVNNAAGAPLYVLISQDTNLQIGETSLHRIILTHDIEQSPYVDIV